ncbi:hypothetical protein TNCV_557821 [Trichonephila clavipes]|nr:hypothetical protein TNCV_557821 [Trichonephila clavipes]
MLTTPLQMGSTDAAWSIGHTQQVCMLIVLLPSNASGNSFSGDHAFLRQQETDLPPAELAGAPAPFFAYDGTIYLSSVGVVLLKHDLSRAVYYTFQLF